MSNSFLHAGTFGDTIYSLNAVKLLGGGDFYIQLNGMDELARKMWGGGDAGDHRGRYTQADIDFIMPLLEKQDYLKSVRIWNNESVDYDLRDQYKLWARREGILENWYGNQTECYAALCGLDIRENRKHLLLDSWIDVDNPITIPGKPIVINRTRRHIRRDTFGFPPINEQWINWIKNDSLTDQSIFIGTELEHYNFCNAHECNIDHYKVTDSLEMARVIKGCEQFIGNQSFALSVAIALGKTFWCEIRVDYENIRTEHGYGDIWFPRANGHYF